MASAPPSTTSPGRRLRLSLEQDLRGQGGVGDGVHQGPGNNLYYEEQGDGPPILLIPQPDLPPPRGGLWLEIWPEPAGSSPTTGVGPPGRGARLSGRPPSIRAMPRRSWTHWRPGRRWWSGAGAGEPAALDADGPGGDRWRGGELAGVGIAAPAAGAWPDELTIAVVTSGGSPRMRLPLSWPARRSRGTGSPRPATARLTPPSELAGHASWWCRWRRRGGSTASGLAWAGPFTDNDCLLARSAVAEVVRHPL